jgi:hypothetical protein
MCLGETVTDVLTTYQKYRTLKGVPERTRSQASKVRPLSVEFVSPACAIEYRVVNVCHVTVNATAQEY